MERAMNVAATFRHNDSSFHSLKQFHRRNRRPPRARIQIIQPPPQLLQGLRPHPAAHGLRACLLLIPLRKAYELFSTLLRPNRIGSPKRTDCMKWPRL
jgi:hypothetical protein